MRHGSDMAFCPLYIWLKHMSSYYHQPSDHSQLAYASSEDLRSYCWVSTPRWHIPEEDEKCHSGVSKWDISQWHDLTSFHCTEPTKHFALERCSSLPWEFHSTVEVLPYGQKLDLATIQQHQYVACIIEKVTLMLTYPYDLITTRLLEVFH